MDDCATRHGSSIQGGSGTASIARASVEKLRGTDPGHGEIGATLWRHTRVLASAWMLVWAVGQMRSFWLAVVALTVPPPMLCTAGSSNCFKHFLNHFPSGGEIFNIIKFNIIVVLPTNSRRRRIFWVSKFSG